MIKTAIIGVGNMGSKYAEIISNEEIGHIKIEAMTRVRGHYAELLKDLIDTGLPIYESADALFDAYDEGQIDLDAVIIATPHFSHEEIAVKAFARGLHVLCDKPSGVYSRQARIMEEAADKSGKVFSMVFNQRTNPLYKEIRSIIQSGKYGALKRVNWVVTDWYRPDNYFKSSSWHATYAKDGGGVLLNQCPHNLDLLQWMCTNPVKVQGFCAEGHYHDIEVEDDVTCFMQWENGATGTFVTSTGDAPGINRLEINLDEAMLVCEGGKLRIGELEPELGMKEAEYRKTSNDFFKKIKGTWKEVEVAASEKPYNQIIQGFVDEILGNGKSLADGREGRKSLILTNAIYLSSWKQKMVELPQIGSDKELEFEKEFEEILDQKRYKRQ